MDTNSVMMQGFEWYLPDDGKYFVRLKERSKELKEAGIDGIWIPPVFKGTGTNDVGYGVYDLYDLGEFDQHGTVRTKYGTLEELQEAIKALHDNDIKVYADVVLNHKANGDFEETFMAVQVDENDRNKEISEAHDIRAWTGFNFPGRGDKYSNFKWNFQHFSGVDYDTLSGTSGIFKIVSVDGDKDWSDEVAGEKGNFDYLMFSDIDHENEDVRQELFKWSEWFVEKLDIDGFRFDALKHISYDFINDFIDNLKGKVPDDFYYFGEYWVPDPDKSNHYLYETSYHTDLFDTGLHYNLEAASQDDNFDMRKIFDGSVVQEHSHLAVTFVDNHDSQPGQSLESFVQPWFKKIAYGITLLRRDGYPCIFYGDYYGIQGDNPIDGQKEVIDNLIWVRKSYAYGEQDDYMEDPELIGWVRHGSEDHPGKLAVVISTGDSKTLRMFVGEDQAGKEYSDLTNGNTNKIVIDEEGYGNFEVGPGTLAAWGGK